MKKRPNHKQTSPSPVQAPAPPSPLTPPAPAGFLGPSVLIPVYVLAIVIAYVLFHYGVATVRGNELSRPRSLFTAINIATLTGFEQATNVSDFTPAGKLITFLLTLVGVFFTFTAAGLAVIRIARLRFTDLQLVVAAFITTAVATTIGAVGLLMDNHSLGLFPAFFNSLSAFSNSGLIAGPLPSPQAWPVHLLLLPLSVAGGLGIPVLMDLFARPRAALSHHTHTVLTYTGGIYILTTLLLLILQYPGDFSSIESWTSALITASRQSLNARSLGFSFEFATYWPRIVQWATIALMLIGASPGGSAGGLKVTTLAALVRGVASALGRPGEAPFIARPLAIALVWVTIYVTLLAASLLLLLSTEPQMPADRLLFLATSALGNVGLSHDPVTLSNTGFDILSATMLAGRIAPILLLWWQAESTPQSIPPSPQSTVAIA